MLFSDAMCVAEELDAVGCYYAEIVYDKDVPEMWEFGEMENEK